MSDLEADVQTKRDAAAERWTRALAGALALYADDRPLAEAAPPLLALIDERCPGWACALVRSSPKSGALEVIAGPNLTEAEAEAILAAAGGPSERMVRHELVFEAVARPAEPAAAILAGRALIAGGLLISDDHSVGALALLARAGWPPPPQVDATLQTIGRVFALMIEDRAAIAAALEREALIELMLDMAPDAIIRIDAAGVIQSYNRAAERVFGYAPQDAIGRSVAMLMGDDHADHHQDYVGRYLRDGRRRLENWRRRFTARCKNGAEIPIEIAVGDLKVKGRPQFVAVIRDVTERVRDERRRGELREALEHAAQLSALGEMAATIAHEVNQPLTAIGNYLDAASALLEAEAPPLAEIAKLVAAAREQASVGGEIVRRVRRLTTRRAPERSLTDVNAAIDETLDYLARSAANAGVVLERVYAAPAPIAHVDRIQIQQVLANLVRNAIAAVAGRAIRRVRVSTEWSDDAQAAPMIDIVVSDSGAGVPESLRERIFESFVSAREGGVGLGLAISRRIIEAHGGVLQLDASNEAGAAFRVRLPLRPEAAEPSA